MPIAAERLAALLPFARPLHVDAPAPAEWDLPSLSGRLSELCGDVLTPAFRLVLDAQRRGEPCAWILSPGVSFYPPDAAEGGVDLDALVVVRAPDADAVARAGAELARSGAFGLLVLDLGADGAVPMALCSRLLGLAQKHDAAVVFLTEPSRRAPPLGSLISLRAEGRRIRRPGDAGGYTCELRVVKDKRRAPGWTFIEACRGPSGLR